MMTDTTAATSKLKNQLDAAIGAAKAELVLKNARIVNVFSNEIETADIAIHQGTIVGIGSYSGQTETDLNGKYVCPGLIDGHIHIESSMLCGPEFEQAVLPHGTTAVITDPHEISNVAGLDGLDFMLETTKDLDLSVYFMLPSCVPATNLDESGAVLKAEDLKPYYENPRVLGLAEMMNAYGTIHGDPDILSKLCDCQNAGKIEDGHMPALGGRELNAYAAAGIRSDHECSDIYEAMEKLRRGEYIMVREGTAAHNLAALLPLFKEPYCERCMLVTDDRHPGELLKEGHIDHIIRKAIASGVDPMVAVKMATLIPAQYFGLDRLGAIAPGYDGDLIVVSDLKHFTVEQVYKKGQLVAANGSALKPAAPLPPVSGTGKPFDAVFHSFHMDEIKPEDLTLKETGSTERVICLTPHELLTSEKLVPFRSFPGMAPGVDISQQIVKLAVFERHHHTGHIGLGFLGGYGLRAGAVASSIAHDSHNLIIAGTNDADMALAGNTVRKNQGGLAFVVNGTVVGELALPVAGLMSLHSAAEVEKSLQHLKQQLKQYGISEDIDAFMTLAFVSLPVIPKLRLNTYGVVDVEKQEVVKAVF